jgi:hypothetical protein
LLNTLFIGISRDKNFNNFSAHLMRFVGLEVFLEKQKPLLLGANYYCKTEYNAQEN